MRTSLKGTLAAATALACAAAAPAAFAGCGEGAMGQPAAWSGRAADLLTPTSLGSATIVGMWKIQFFVGQTQVDFGYAQWHADGTEFMNSGGRAPATQNYCLGVWTQTGPFSYHLNHFAISYDNSGVLNANVNIKEDVTVDAKADSFSGPFTIDVHDPNDGHVLQHVAGTVIGHRVPAI